MQKRILIYVISFLSLSCVMGCEDDRLVSSLPSDTPVDSDTPEDEGGTSPPGEDGDKTDESDGSSDGDGPSKEEDQEKPSVDVACEDECEQGEKGCDGFGMKECGNYDPDPCMEWSEAQPCEFGCDEANECRDGVIVEPCKSACVNGTTVCEGEGFRVCADTDLDGCTEWSDITPCSKDEACTDGVCQVQPPACTNVCVAGSVECSGDGYRTCGDTNADGCTDWSNVVRCGFGCSSGQCLEDPNAWVPACKTSVCPKVISSFPYRGSGNTASSTNLIGAYGCDTSVNEAGPEEYYVFKVDEPGTVVAGITEPSGGDVDVHLLRSLTSDGCLSRSDKGIGTHVDAGIYYLSIDTYVSASKAGAYNLYVTFLPDSGKCGLAQTTINRYNTPSTIQLPQTGKIVKEAHMVTDHDQAVHGKGWWPSTSQENLAEHKKYTAEITGFTGAGTEAWCPANEGGCEYGQGSTGVAVPALAEAWYICMYWKNKPAKGTRFLVMNPSNGKAVVAAAGYETGPGDGSRLGGAVEEVHDYCGTKHLGTLMFAELKDQTLPYGQITCD